MSRGGALATLSPLTAEQWGMFTAAQARELRVSRADINRLIWDGTLERIESAARVYRFTGSPPDPELDELRAAWLQLGEGSSTARRLRDPDAVVSHRSAATALDLGDLLADVHEFYSPVRRRLRRPDVRIRVRADLPAEAWRVVRGLPVTTAARLVSDLLSEREDESAIARIVQDALHAGLLTRAELDEIVPDHIAPYGAPSEAALSETLAGARR